VDSKIVAGRCDTRTGSVYKPRARCSARLGVSPACNATSDIPASDSIRDLRARHAFGRVAQAGAQDSAGRPAGPGLNLFTQTGGGVGDEGKASQKTLARRHFR